MKYFILVLIFLHQSLLFSQEADKEDTPIKEEKHSEQTKEDLKNKKSPHLAALLGVIPGLGQFYLGNHRTSAVQLISFLSINAAENHFRSQPDYINYYDRDVKFDINEAVIGYSLQKNGWVYNDMPYKVVLQDQKFYKDLGYPIFSETTFDRELRLWKERKLAEENTFVKYGEYSRTSRSSVYADMLNNPVLSIMMYSVYSSYRDAGGSGEEKKTETINQLAFAPFNPSILKKTEVFIPIAFFAALAAATYKWGNPILLPRSVKRDGSLYLEAFVDGISPAIGEEAFFRGYVNHSVSSRFGPAAGIGTSSLLFMLAHEANSDAKEGRVGRMLAGLYFGWLHYRNNYDIRPGIAVHFWNNFLIGLSMMAQYKADRNYDKSQKEVYFMPINFTFQL
ncbi:MAG: CPBP family intramembrane metalloprotease [Leptospiraceae bacterium]|nr:CPBP family intramembrane metalloprotease [Leptospiraceae bacterium]MCP5495400.1 CPBP family intramembrane metalloprotease [Leptospiraceae bacterium]